MNFDKLLVGMHYQLQYSMLDNLLRIIKTPLQMAYKELVEAVVDFEMARYFA